MGRIQMIKCICRRQPEICTQTHNKVEDKVVIRHWVFFISFSSPPFLPNTKIWKEKTAQMEKNRSNSKIHLTCTFTKHYHYFCYSICHHLLPVLHILFFTMTLFFQLEVRLILTIPALMKEKWKCWPFLPLQGLSDLSYTSSSIPRWGR